MKLLTLTLAINFAAASLLNIQQEDHQQNILVVDETADPVFKTFSLPSLPDYKLRVKENIKLCDSVNQVTGYLDIGKDQSYFWWFFESRNSSTDDPLVLWLNGGPGCSSFTGLLLELGPCKVSSDAKSLISNPFSWNSNANIIFLDQPVGTGFSYGSEKVHSSQQAAQGVYSFLQIFLAAYKKEPFAQSPFHIAGESYAGHYLPEIAKVIIERAGEHSINLESVLIGNGIVDALIQNKHYATFLEDKKYGKILSKGEIKRMRRGYPKCKRMVQQCYDTGKSSICRRSAHYCSQVNFLAFDWLTDLSYYDVRKQSDYYDKYDKRIEKFLNRKEVQTELGVNRHFAGCSDKVFERFDHFGDESRNIIKDIPIILHAGVRLLIYAGDADFICNWVGNKAWTLEVEWSGSKGFQNAPDEIWKSALAGKDSGELRTFENLSFLRIFEAGHFVPFDQSAASLDFFNSWISNSLHRYKI